MSSQLPPILEISSPTSPQISSGLKRASSTASVSSDGDELSFETRNVSRKRFSDRQVSGLEDLYRRATHPSRAERESLAAELEMEGKQVTIWFQNRRQADRKAGILPHESPSTPVPAGPPSSPFATIPARTPASSAFAGALNPFAPGPMALSKAYAKQVRKHHAPLPTPLPASRQPQLSPASRISLDALADRSRTPRRATRMGVTRGASQDSILSSPLPESPSTAEATVLAFGRPRTLEWACAQARFGHRRRGSEETVAELTPKRKRSASGQAVASLSGRKKAKSFSAGSADEPSGSSRSNGSRELGLGAKRLPLDVIADRGREKAGRRALLDESEAHHDPGEDTEEEEEHEAITPMSSLNGETFFRAPRGVAGSLSLSSKAKNGAITNAASTTAAPDDELMSAALVLCGLGRNA